MTISVIRNGKFGVYINYDKKNIALKYSKHFKSLNKSHENLTKRIRCNYENILNIRIKKVNSQLNYQSKTSRLLMVEMS